MSAIFSLLVGGLNGQTSQDNWNRMFHGASPTPTPATKTAAPSDASGTNIMTDARAQLTWFISPAQLSRLQPWQPDRAEPAVPLTELARRAKEYADKSFHERGWLLSDVGMSWIAGTNHTKWYYRFVLSRPWIIPEGQSYRSTMDIPPNSHLQRAPGADTAIVVLLHDGTVIEPVSTKAK